MVVLDDGVIDDVLDLLGVTEGTINTSFPKEFLLKFFSSSGNELRQSLNIWARDGRNRSSQENEKNRLSPERSATLMPNLYFS